ncbi:MAG: hypothetical protein ACLQME_11025 [Alphaproteobacteria bacterium]
MRSTALEIDDAREMLTLRDAVSKADHDYGPAGNARLMLLKRRIAKAGHDVSQEARDEHGRWTASEGGDDEPLERTRRALATIPATPAVKEGMARGVLTAAHKVTALVAGEARKARRTVTGTMLTGVKPVVGGGVQYGFAHRLDTPHAHVTSAVQVHPATLAGAGAAASGIGALIGHRYPAAGALVRGASQAGMAAAQSRLADIHAAARKANRGKPLVPANVFKPVSWQYQNGPGPFAETEE